MKKSPKRNTQNHSPREEANPPTARIDHKADGGTFRAVNVVAGDTFKITIESLADDIQFKANGLGCETPEVATVNLAGVHGDLIDAECGRHGPGVADAIIETQVARAKCRRVDVASNATPEKCAIRAKNRGWGREET